jgi:hypothetical protein
MNTPALLLARMSDPESLLPAAKVLEHSEIVEWWYAVDGHIDLVAKLSAPSTELLSEIQSLRGVQKVEVLELSDGSGNLLCNPSSCYSFVFLEVEAERLGAIRTMLTDLNQVIFCASRRGASELVAVVSGDSFQSIDRMINDQMRVVDGVLRLKQDRIINLKQI